MPANSFGWIVKFNLKPGSLDAFRKIAEGAIEAVRKSEPRVVVYECFLSEDKTRIEVHEWFADQEAALAHLQGIAPREYLPRLLQHAEFRGLELYGTPGPELAKALESFPVAGRSLHLGGFTRAAPVGLETA